MRAVAVSVWIFINLLFFGMCGYMYLLWSQYWYQYDKNDGLTTDVYDQQIYFYNRGIEMSQTSENLLNLVNSSAFINKRHANENKLTNSKPRFPNLDSNQFELDSKKYRCTNYELKICQEKTSEFKKRVLRELSRVEVDESNVFKEGNLNNTYNVKFEGTRTDFTSKTPSEIYCDLKKNVQIETLNKENRDTSILYRYLPKRKWPFGKKYKSCALVTSAGALKGSNLGQLIDSHEIVLRFNNAPTANFEKDVGSKTSIRILNSQVVSKEKFNFVNSSLYKNVTLVMWDPSNYTEELKNWVEHPDYNFVPNYVQFKKNNPKSRFFIVNPKSLWELWNFLQRYSTVRLRRNPPSSGFLGLSLLLSICDFVDLFEYIPSTRVSKKCHYYDSEDNPACTFGVWHPLAAEKLLTYHLNTADDFAVFQRGVIRITNFEGAKC